MIKKGLLFGAFTLLAVAQATAQTHPWPMAFGDPARTQQSFAAGPNDDSTLEWKYVVPGPVPALVVSNTGDITIGATFHNQWWSYEVFTTQVDPLGKINWRKKMDPYVWGYSQGVGAGAAIDPNGDIIVPSSKSQLIKMTPGGNATWTIDGNDGAPNDAQIAVLADGSIRWMQSGYLYVLTSSGVSTYSRIVSGRAMAVGANGDIMIEYGRTSGSSNSTARVYLNPDLSIRWSQVAWRGGTGRMPVLGPDNTLYQGGKAMRASDGATLWQDPNAVANFANALGKNGQMYTLGQEIRAYNKDTGSVLWTTTLTGTPVKHVAIDSRDIIYAALDNGKVVAVGPAGSILWEKQVCDEFISGPVIGTDGRLMAVGRTISRNYIFTIK